VAKPLTNSNLIYASLFDLSLGVFFDRHEVSIPLGGASATSNLIWLGGYVRARPGLDNIYPQLDGNKIVHLSQFVPLLGDVRLMRVSKSGTDTMHVHYYTQGTGWVAVTGGAGVSGVLSSTDPPRSVNFKGVWYLVPGNGPLYQYDGTTFVTTSSVIGAPGTNDEKKPFDKPKYIAATEARLFIANTTDAISGGTRVPYRIQWCDFNLPLVWSTGGTTGNGSSRYVDLPSGSEAITGIYAGSNATLLIFKAREVYIGVQAQSPLFFDFRVLQKGPGCVSSSTIKEWRDGKILHLGDDNIYLTVPGQIPQPVGDRILPRLSDLSSLIQLDLSRAWIDRDNDLYCLIIPDVDGKVIKTFTLCLRNMSWWEGSYNLGTDFITDGYEFRSGVWQSKELLSTNQGLIYESTLGKTMDGSNNFSTSWTSGILQIRQISQNQADQASMQMIRGFAPLDDGGNSIQLSVDRGDGLDRFTNTIYGTQYFDGLSPIKVDERPLDGEHFRVNYSSTTANTTPRMTGLQIGFILHGNTR